MKIYLTIDDAPSKNSSKKIQFLKKSAIPALFYLRGEFLERNPAPIIEAIKAGFLVGNHSYSHPYFSKIGLKACFDEILRTESLIEKCYKQANKKRVHKIIRFPFGDRGAINRIPLQEFLKKEGFVKVLFEGHDDNIDALWDWDPKDYKRSHIQDSQRYLDNLKTFYDEYSKSTAVIVLHDFDHQQHLFTSTMDFLMHKTAFLDFKFA